MRLHQPGTDKIDVAHLLPLAAQQFLRCNKAQGCGGRQIMQLRARQPTEHGCVFNPVLNPAPQVKAQALVQAVPAALQFLEQLTVQFITD